MAGAVAMGAIVILAPTASAAGPGDVEAVYCLRDDRRPEVVKAAIHLGKGAEVPGSPDMLAIGADKRPVTLEEWRRDHREDFDKVCSALIKANSDNPAGGGSNGPWSSLLLLVAGSALTTFGAMLERVAAHRRHRLDRLVPAIDEFRGSAEDYLAAWTYNADTPHDRVRDDRRNLTAALQGLAAGGARGRTVRALSVELPLARPLSGIVPEQAGRTRQKTFDQRRQEAARQRTSLEEALAKAELLSRGALAWRWRRVRERVAAGGQNDDRTGPRGFLRSRRHNKLPGEDGE
ncbi:MAG TPA: hypothetical protein VFU43_13760 [Streptosporangiaceae bacterium]|nr:hypothetical protein [Streptosporangiaceae bacterium]